MVKLRNSKDLIGLYDDLFEAEQWDVLDSGNEIVSENERTEKVFVLRRGLAKVCLKHNNKNVSLGYFVAGDMIGVLNFEKCFNFPYSVITLSKTEVYSVDRCRMEEVIKLVPAVAYNLNEQRARWDSNTINRLKALLFYTPYQRVVDWIIDYNRFDCYKSNNIWTMLRTEDMAEYCNLAPFLYNSYISSLALSKIIRLTNRGIIILDPQRLQSILTEKPNN